MEVRIKTLQEFRDSRVTIEIIADDQAEVEDLATALTLTTNSREFNRARVLDQTKIIRDQDSKIKMLEVDVDSLQRQLAEQRERADRAEAANTRAAIDYAFQQNQVKVIEQLEADVLNLREQLAKQVTLTKAERGPRIAAEDLVTEIRRLVYRAVIDRVMAAKDTEPLDGYAAMMAITLHRIRYTVGDPSLPGQG